MVNSSLICVCYVVTIQSAEIQIGRTGPEITGLCSSLFSKPNLQNRILYERKIKRHTGSCIFIAFKSRANIGGNITDLVKNALLYNARKKIILKNISLLINSKGPESFLRSKQSMNSLPFMISEY